MGETARELPQNRWRELSLRFGSLGCVDAHISPQNTESGAHGSGICCAAVRIARLAFIRVASVPRGIAEWLARVDCFRWVLVRKPGGVQSSSSMEDWDADLSPCNFATTLLPVETKQFHLIVTLRPPI